MRRLAVPYCRVHSRDWAIICPFYVDEVSYILTSMCPLCVYSGIREVYYDGVMRRF